MSDWCRNLDIGARAMNAGPSATTQVRPPWMTQPERLITLALLIGIGALAIKAVDVAKYDVAILRFPFQWDDAEGVILAEATLIAHRINPYAYQPSPSSHFYAGPYTPLYTLINAAGISLVGATFKVGRIVQLLATLGVGAWIAWAVSRVAKTGMTLLAGIWAGAIFLTAHLVAFWSILVRPDMTALLWNLIGVTILLRRRDVPEFMRSPRKGWPDRRTIGTLALGAGCFALGWWTKQTFLAVPLAYVLFLFLQHPKAALVLGGVFGTMVLVPFGLLTLVTSGGFAQKILEYQGSWQWHAYRRLVQPFVERYAFLLALAFLAALCVCVHARHITFSALWFLLSMVPAFGAGTSGGNHNHFVEIIAAACLLIGQGAALIVTSPHASALLKTRWTIAASMMLIVLIVTGVASTEREGRANWLAREYRRPTASEHSGLEQVASYIANTRGPVYSDNIGILVVAGQPVMITDPFTMATEVRLGRWDDTALVDDIAAGRYGLIALRYDVTRVNADNPPTDMTPELVRAIQARYRLIANNILKLYAPIGQVSGARNVDLSVVRR